MVIEIALLPPVVQQQIMETGQGEVIEFVNNGELIGKMSKLSKSQSCADSLMATAGLWQEFGIDGLAYQQNIRNEWSREWDE